MSKGKLENTVCGHVDKKRGLKKIKVFPHLKNHPVLDEILKEKEYFTLENQKHVINALD
jgi:hypothetical protein